MKHAGTTLLTSLVLTILTAPFATEAQSPTTIPCPITVITPDVSCAA